MGFNDKLLEETVTVFNGAAVLVANAATLSFPTNLHGFCRELRTCRESFGGMRLVRRPLLALAQWEEGPESWKSLKIKQETHDRLHSASASPKRSFTCREDVPRSHVPFTGFLDDDTAAARTEEINDPNNHIRSRFEERPGPIVELTGLTKRERSLQL